MINFQKRIEKFQELVTFSLNTLKKLNLKSLDRGVIITKIESK